MDFDMDFDDLGLDIIDEIQNEDNQDLNIEDTYLVSEMLYEFYIEDKLIQLPFYFTTNLELLNLLNTSSELIDDTSYQYVLPFCKPVRNVRFFEKFHFNKVIALSYSNFEEVLSIEEEYKSYYIFLLKMII